ncbi:hypothetical protein [Microbacterium maritypicum]|uniref:Uncharacterized protein n=1 Tax=Microbacterium maritypicum MF109 TaxID=1333857 RepID=T5KNQ9_MICMQ|nr:hypothetical protein [Microbacterium liquefaciens]EQM78208.1 hypothetical protein L687_16915 [Microbacterium maritypicum MF109]
MNRAHLSEVREDLRKALEGLEVYTYNHIPGSTAQPSAVVLGGSPYGEAGQTFETWTLRLEVWVSASKGDNGSETNQADELVNAAIEAIHSYDSPLIEDGYEVSGFSQPFEWAINNGQAFTIAINVTASGVTFN